MRSLPGLFGLVALVTFSGCAANAMQSGSTHARVVEPGSTYDVRVANRSSCPASVRLQRTTNEQPVVLGTVPSYATDTFVVTPTQKASVVAYANEPDGRNCGGGLENNVDVSITRRG